MPKLVHPVTGATWQVPAKVAPFWTGRAGWRLADTAPRPRTKRGSKRATKTPPAQTAGAPDEGPGEGSSTTQHTEE